LNYNLIKKGPAMYSRRDFLRTSVSSSTLIALAPTVPEFLAQTARAAEPRRDSRILVVVELGGGNDGINTIVPFADEGYAKHRKVLRLPTDRLLKINKEVGLHPDMTDAAKLLEDGRLAIVQGVGYPNPSRSHFKSMAIWHSANVKLPRNTDQDAESKAAYGWIGQALDEARPPADRSPAAQFVGNGSVPAALRSRHVVASAVTRLEDAVLALEGGASSAATEKPADRDFAAFVRRSTLDAYATSERMAQILRAPDKSASYPATALADRLRAIARLIKSGGGTRVFYTVQGSAGINYDTHYRQTPMHGPLLSELSGALRAFLDDLAAAKLADRVLVLCFSEFGRRVEENGTGDGAGTDHGTAGPVFVAGPGVKAGLVGETPKLLDLQDGDLKMSVDFRRVYATVLEEWLGLPSKPSLGGTFEKLPLFKV
jgi:uncharacterized protein (DUF1501 family)